ncbi:MAG: hypothetical protein AAGB10_08150 [Pseudomonadota bacterium]
MRDITKIATCCYCGNRTILTLVGQVQHELACGSCGARLHTMKHLKAPQSKSKSSTKRSPKPVERRPAQTEHKKKKQKSSRRRFEFSDLIEDIWDEIEDIFD